MRHLPTVSKALPLRGSLFRLGVSVMSDAVERVPIGRRELTLFEAVGPGA
jgi:hypothetical protein